MISDLSHNQILQKRAYQKSGGLPLNRNRPDVRLYHNLRIWPPKRSEVAGGGYHKNQTQKHQSNRGMGKTEENRNKWLHIRLTAAESELIRRKVQRTTCRKISDYVRKIILSEPITVNYRNESLDSLMSTLIELRRELSAIGNNFNQAVKRLQMLSQISEYSSWLTEYEQDKKAVLRMIETIQFEISKAAKTWLQ